MYRTDRLVNSIGAMYLSVPVSLRSLAAFHFKRLARSQQENGDKYIMKNGKPTLGDMFLGQISK